MKVVAWCLRLFVATVHIYDVRGTATSASQATVDVVASGREIPFMLARADQESDLIMHQVEPVGGDSTYQGDKGSVVDRNIQRRSLRNTPSVVMRALLLKQQQEEDDEHRALAREDDDILEEEQVHAADSPSTTSCTMCPPNEGEGLNSPTIAPAPSLPTPLPSTHDDDRPTQPPYQQDWGRAYGGGIDFLVAAFFFIAAGWLILALLYSILVLIVVRLRARGELDIYDEHFGRLYLIGRHCYIPLGCILRRYVVALSEEETSSPVRIMTREERRLAMEELLGRAPASTTPSDGDEGTSREQDTRRSGAQDNPARPEVTEATTNHGTAETAPSSPTAANPEQEETKQEDELWLDNNEPVCSICLMEYEEGEEDDVFHSNVCQHEFHKVCLLDWLERRNNTECPVCRTALVSDEDVWEAVQRRRKSYRESNRSGYCCLPCCCGDRPPDTRVGTDDYGADIEMGDQNEITDPSVLIAADTSHHRYQELQSAPEGADVDEEHQEGGQVGLTDSNNETPVAQVNDVDEGDQQITAKSNEDSEDSVQDAGRAPTSADEETDMSDPTPSKKGT